jgi:hypothetical protein
MDGVIIALIDALIDGLGNAIGWVIIGLMAFLAELYRRFKTLRSDVDDLERYLTGDDDDPDSPGLLAKVEKVDDDLNDLKTETREQHRKTDSKLDRLLEDEQ